MLRHSLVAAIVVAWTLTGGVTRAAAQTGQAGKFGVDASYDFLFKSFTSNAGLHVSGWMLVSPRERYEIRGLGELGLTHFDGFNLTSLQVGPRILFKLEGNPKISPLVQVLVGFEHCCGENDLSIQPGGGIVYAYSPTLSLLFQIDFRHVTFEGGSENHQRYSAGVLIPLGSQ